MPIYRTQAEPPSLAYRVTFGAVTLVATPVIWLLSAVQWVIKVITCQSDNPHRAQAEALLRAHVAHQVPHEELIDGLTGHLIHLLSGDLNEGSYDFIVDFLALSELHPKFHHILAGANVHLQGDDGFFANKWSQIPGAYERYSSHRYHEGHCHGFSGRVFNELLFWKSTDDDDTRFQVESAPVNSFISLLFHLYDYLVYRRDNEQQSQFGSSPHTEDHPIMINVDLDEYRRRAAEIRTQLAADAALPSNVSS